LFFFSSRRRHTRSKRDWSSDVCSSDLDQAGLWTDGRYFIQAAAQLANSEVELFKMGEENVPTVIEFIRDHLVQGGGLGFDGRVRSEERRVGNEWRYG